MTFVDIGRLLVHYTPLAGRYAGRVDSVCTVVAAAGTRFAW